MNSVRRPTEDDPEPTIRQQQPDGGPGPLVTIVVPVYNIAANIQSCARSLAEQTHQNIEVVLVDDGSTDGSERICRDIVEGDSRFRLLSKPNGGLSSARNAGVREAHGDLLMFVDGDDILSPDAVTRLVRALAEEDVDMAIGPMRKITTYDVSRLCGPDDEEYRVERLNGPRELLISMLYGNQFDVSGCSKLARRSFWETHRFPEGRYYEDLRSMGATIRDLRAAAVVGGPVYGYFMRAGSITSKRVAPVDQCRDYFTAVEELRDSVGPVDGDLADALRCRCTNEYVRMYRLLDFYGHDPELAHMARYIREYVRHGLVDLVRSSRTPRIVKVRASVLVVVPRLYSLIYYAAQRLSGKRFG